MARLSGKKGILMRVLMQSRKNFFSLPGGDTVQLTKTKEQLEKLGVVVDISLEFEPDLTGYDIVHLSNVTRIQETYLQVMNAQKQNKPIVLSTIFWPMDEFEKVGQAGIRRMIGKVLSINGEEKIKAIARYIKDRESRNEATKNLWRVGYRNMQDYVVNHVNYFLPNSEMEMYEFSEYFNIKKERYTVVPNAVDQSSVKMNMNNSEAKEFDQYKDSVICVGRIETRKNQLALLQALKGTNYKVVLVGKPSQNQPSYFKKVKNIIDLEPNFTHIEHIDNEKLYSLYKICRVSVLPSWLDTPGLVSLEAGAMGCNLVVSTRGSTKEYFKNYAEYCEPNDLESIRSAVERAYNKEKNTELQEHILNNYTWEIAGEKTLAAYSMLM